MMIFFVIYSLLNNSGEDKYSEEKDFYVNKTHIMTKSFVLSSGVLASINFS